VEFHRREISFCSHKCSLEYVNNDKNIKLKRSNNINHTYKNKITTSFDYSITDNVIMETNEQRGNIYYSRPGNFAKEISLSLISISFPNSSLRCELFDPATTFAFFNVIDVKLSIILID
jgi:hypothetical protein